MAQDERDLPGVELVDDRVRFSLREVCELCGVHADCIVEWVETGVLEPSGRHPVEWRFSARQLLRSQRALRLRRDLELNPPGLAVTLDLLDEVARLRSRIRSLEHQLYRLLDG
jgi:chaperone modulatory protein CbpM